MGQNKHIDTSTLYIGRIFKNYLDLCRFLGEIPVPNNNTNGRKAHEKELRRFFDWEKEGAGHKIRITRIYDVPKDKIDKRVNGNHSKYVEFIERILIYLLVGSGGLLSSTTRELYQLLGMVNDRYNPEMYHERENKGIREFYVKDFYRRMGQRLRGILFSSLNNLKRRGLIEFEEETYIAQIKDDGNGRFKLANEEEVAIIKAIEEDVLTDMNLKNKSDVAWRFKFKEFYRKVDALLEEYDWEYSFTKQKITLLETEAVIDEDISQLRIKLNALIVEFADNQAKEYERNEPIKYAQKNPPFDDWGANSLTPFIRLYKNDYVEEQERLAKMLLKL